MSKPRLFIGSSSEGLPVAEGVQRNIWQAVEVTPWSQGVFEPSRGSLESILAKLDDQDFGLFVFSPDDVTQMRGEANRTARDNVLFELGIFIGRLGRDRCYFLIPDGPGEQLHIPTDLAGITPLLYEYGRTDGNLVAATGAACAELKAQILRLGIRPRPLSDSSGSIAPVSPPVVGNGDRSESLVEVAAAQAEKPQAQESQLGNKDEDQFAWFEAYQEHQFDQAAKLLERRIAKVTDSNEKAALVAVHGRAVYRLDPAKGERLLLEAIEAYPDDPLPYAQLGYAYLQDSRPEKAIAIAERGLAHAGASTLLVSVKVDALKLTKGVAEAIECLESVVQKEDSADSELHISLAKLYEENEDSDGARRALDRGVRRLPTDRDLLQRFADFLEKHFDAKLGLIPRNALVALDPKNANYITLRANLYLRLDLVDAAMRDYERANDLAEAKEGWILGNIGNLYHFKGFNNSAIQFLNKGLAIEPDSQYMHERLARALEARAEEDAKLAQLEKEARAALVTLRLADQVYTKPVVTTPSEPGTTPSENANS